MRTGRLRVSKSVAESKLECKTLDWFRFTLIFFSPLWMKCKDIFQGRDEGNEMILLGQGS